MTGSNIKDNSGFILITLYMAIAVLMILAAAFTARSISEQRVADKNRDSNQAFWLAEAGLDKAIAKLPSSPLSGSLGEGKYYTETSQISPIRFSIVSKGGVPDVDQTNINNAIRIIRAIVERPVNDADPSEITSAITSNGAVTMRGSAEVNGDIDEYAEFDFGEIFGISKETMQSNATNSYDNPENNVTPVNSITWANVDSGHEMIVADAHWQGSGILVVSGDLRITGGYFRGIIWVVGTLWVSGNPVIDGTIFVESGVEFETTVIGDSTVNYDADAISDVFGFLPSDLPPYIVSWDED
ncbi:MAG: hypothetical protein KKC66_06565 [Candidatus Omnitrophica bacterium]|nr:hypothetical protein [Candidatus Omnitrophota bacterium]